MEKPDLSFLSVEEESATEESSTLHKEKHLFVGSNNPPSQGSEGPKEGSEGSNLCPSRQRLKQSILLLLVAPPGDNSSCQAVKTEVKPEPAVKDKV